ncbi:DUF5672 family protein [Chryseobacterium jejuense]|uniref:DUF5672 domain-containing protein n=1 Tax=Chryseobacterium jejuense TaxID=445960 RepID=A0A2X2Z7F7_CHRJE|nr:DUF5672 family protein [Chryseobacterium jejuense]SDJ51391.1 hypothetical protein SAMN05421542_3636 [Chryseobacterium jejuense]SQB46360.1 Uncharacterised protein [Chryseobacterium jejuense]
MVDIIIPIYKQIPDSDDLISLNQVFCILGNYKITFIHPRSLDISAYKKFSASFIEFDDIYFKNIYGYNQLMMNLDFYQKFSEKYILIYQTDCFVFKDQLIEWCKKDFDYIGAPWLRTSEKIPFIKLLFDKGISKFKTIINFRNNGRWQKDKSLLYNNVGNGGFSLRKREKFVEILERIPNVADIYLKKENSGQFYAEDVFFSIEPERNGIIFSKPNYREACLFSIENKQQKALDINNGEIPFGCHRWNKEKNFWREIFKKYNVQI